jgi:multiple sugar transport system ATP-binding protein
VAGFIGSPAMNIVDTALRKEGDNFYVELAPGSRVVIPTEKTAKLDAHVDTKVFFGIRPEHISIASSKDDLNAIEGKLAVVENMGNEKYLHFRVGANLVIARVSGCDISTSDIGNSYYFNLDTSFCHIFDGKEEQNISL